LGVTLLGHDLELARQPQRRQEISQLFENVALPQAIIN